MGVGGGVQENPCGMRKRMDVHRERKIILMYVCMYRMYSTYGSIYVTLHI